MFPVTADGQARQREVEGGAWLGVGHAAIPSYAESFAFPFADFS